MSDVFCPKCGEEYEAFGITYAKGEGDFTLAQVEKFLRGEGCPACVFGTICPRCSGGRIERNNCETCFGGGLVIARRCALAADARFRHWFVGYANSPTHPLRFFKDADVALRVALENEESLDGPVQVARIQCPDCLGQGEPCAECGGDGKFHAEKHPANLDSAMRRLLANSDAEPLGVMARFMRGAAK